jgi:hypothetical protein
MIEQIAPDAFPKIHDRLTFPYEAYQRWKNEESQSNSQFHSVGSNTCAIRPREDWNAHGREIYYLQDVERHADTVAEILSDIKLGNFLVEQVIPSAAWFAGKAPNGPGRARAAADYLHSRGISVDFSTWRGAFVVHDDICGFLRHFLDYPFVFKTYDLDVFAFEAPLVIEINHHLSLVFTSPDRSLIADIRSQIVAKGILEYPDRGTQ